MSTEQKKPKRKKVQKKKTKARSPPDVKKHRRKDSAIRPCDVDTKNARSWESFDFAIPGIQISEMRHFMRVYRELGHRNPCQTFRFLLYKYEESRYK